MENISFYDEICREIKLYEEKIEEIRYALSKFIEIHLNPGGGLRGISYEEEKVKKSNKKISFQESIENFGFEKERKLLTRYTDKIDKLYEIKDVLEKCYENSDIFDKVYFYRHIKKKTQRETGEILGYSTRQIRRLEKKIKVSDSDTM